MAASFRVGAVTGATLRRWQMQRGGGDCFIFTFASTPALPSSRFESTSYLRFVSQQLTEPRNASQSFVFGDFLIRLILQVSLWFVCYINAGKMCPGQI